MAVGDARLFPEFLTLVLTQISFQSHRLLLSHASAEVIGENTPERKLASNRSRTQNHKVVSPTCSPLRGAINNESIVNYCTLQQVKPFWLKEKNTVFFARFYDVFFVVVVVVAFVYPFPKQAIVFTCLLYKSFENNVGKIDIKNESMVITVHYLQVRTFMLKEENTVSFDRFFPHPFPIVLTCLLCKSLENTDGKGEIARIEHFLPCPQSFPPSWNPRRYFHQI